MPSLNLEWDSRDLDVWRGKKVDKALTRALSKAGGDALRAMKIASSRSVRFRKRIKLARINAGLPLEYPRGEKDLSALVWTMRVSGERVRLVDFAKQTKRGVMVAVNQGKRVLFKSAFIAVMRSGHRGVFFRKGKAKLPIEEAQFTTRISDVFNDNGMIPAVQARTQTVFSSSFARLLPLELGKIT